MIKKKKLVLLDKIVLVLNILASVALLLSYLAPYADPRDFSIIAILGFGYQVLLIINIPPIIYWLIRRKIYILISTLSILLGFSAITANFGFRFGGDKLAGKSSEDLIRMMSYNVHGFHGIEQNEEAPIQSDIFRIISERQPDIINFEEFEVAKADKGAITDSLKKILNSNYYYFKPLAIGRKDTAGNAIFSKYPIIDTGSIPAPTGLKMMTIFVDLKYKGGIVRVYCVHLAAVQMKEKDKKKYLRGTLNLDRSSYIEGRLNSAFVIRSYQVAKIKAHMNKCPYPYIVAGDFNDTPISYAVNQLSDGLKNAFTEKGSGFGTTYYSTFPKLHIDYILVSPHFDVFNYQTIERKLSDHKPILTDLFLNNRR